jgi:hypothetical protein
LLASDIQIVEIEFGLSTPGRPLDEKDDTMKKTRNIKERNNGLRPEYDLSKLKGGVRGKYALRLKTETNLVLLSPDVARFFPNERSVNAALRSLIDIAKTRVRQVP